jgi:hypothetical protein
VNCTHNARKKRPSEQYALLKKRDGNKRDKKNFEGGRQSRDSKKRCWKLKGVLTTMKKFAGSGLVNAMFYLAVARL